MKYLDVYVVISPARDRDFEVNVSSQAGGQGNSILKLPFEMRDLAGVIFGGGVDRRIGNADRPEVPVGTASTFGVELFEALFQGETREVLSLTESEAKRMADTGVRIRLSMNLSADGMAEVASLPWELMRRRDQAPLVVSAHTPVVRAFDTPIAIRVRPMTGKLRILALVSNPLGTAALDLQQEKDRIGAIWSKLANVEVDFVRPVEHEILDHLAENDYHVVHYMGHGDFDSGAGGLLMMEQKDGRAHLVNGDTFAVWLKDKPLRLVFLNACNTGTIGRQTSLHPFAGVASALIRSGKPAVVAMQFPISDQSAIIFAQTFYQRIAQGYPVDAAVGEGRKRLLSSEGAEWATPVLYMRAADGNLFDNSEAPSPPQSPVAKPQATTAAAAETTDADLVGSALPAAAPALPVAPAAPTPVTPATTHSDAAIAAAGASQPPRAADDVFPGPADIGKRSFGLADLKKKNQARQIFQFSLPKHELHDTQAISDFVTEFLDSYKLIDNVKAATVWVSNELLRNAFLHGNFHDDGDVDLTLSSTSGGVSIRVAQPDDQGFDLARILDDPEKSDSFLQMISRRGLRIQVARISGRLEIAVELPSNLGLNSIPVDRAIVGNGLPADVSRFVGRMVDICVHEHVVMARCYFLTVDESNSGSFETWLREHISMIEPSKGVVVVDLADVLYLPSLGLRELSKALREARKRKVDIVLAGASVELRQVFRISNYDKLFRIFDDSEAAFRSLSAPA